MVRRLVLASLVVLSVSAPVDARRETVTISELGTGRIRQFTIQTSGDDVDISGLTPLLLEQVNLEEHRADMDRILEEVRSMRNPLLQILEDD